MTNQQREKTFIHLTQITWIMHHCLIKYIMHAWQTDAKRSARSQIKWLVMSNESFLLKFKFKCESKKFDQVWALDKASMSNVRRKKREAFNEIQTIKIKSPVMQCCQTIHHIQNKSFSLHNMCVLCVFIMCIYKNTHTCIYLRKICYVYILNMI